MRRVVEEIWNRGVLDVADALFAPTYVNHGGLIPDLTLGPESIKVSVALFRAAFPSLHVSVESLAADGDDVMLIWTARSAPPHSGAPATSRNRETDRGTVKARDSGEAGDFVDPLGSLSPGATGTLPGTTRFRFEGERIVESWMTWDEAGVLRRLGLAGTQKAQRRGGQG